MGTTIIATATTTTGTTTTTPGTTTTMGAITTTATLRPVPDRATATPQLRLPPRTLTTTTTKVPHPVLSPFPKRPQRPTVPTPLSQATPLLVSLLESPHQLMFLSSADQPP